MLSPDGIYTNVTILVQIPYCLINTGVYCSHNLFWWTIPLLVP